MTISCQTNDGNVTYSRTLIQAIRVYPGLVWESRLTFGLAGNVQRGLLGNELDSVIRGKFNHHHTVKAGGGWKVRMDSNTHTVDRITSNIFIIGLLPSSFRM